MRSNNDGTVSLQVAALHRSQVVVLGAGMAGVFAALGAARAGARVTLVEQEAFVGGQGTVGGVHTFCGDTANVNDDWREMTRRLAAFDGGLAPFDPNDDGRAFSAEHLKYVAQEMLEEAGVDVWLHTRLIATERSGDAVRAVLVHNKSGLIRIVAQQFVDATGDADAVAGGGWPTEQGGPSFTPTKDGLKLLDRRLPLPMSLYFALVDIGRPVQAELPSGGITWEDDDDLPMTSVYQHDGLVVIKMKVVGHDAVVGRSLAAAEQAARRQALSLVYHLQTRGYHGHRYSTHRLAWVAPHVGIREGRRIQAVRPLRLADLVAGAHFDDAVAVGSYHIDYHWPADVRRAGTGLTTQVPPYQIPLAAMRPVSSDNLLVPGRCMGGEQIAMSSYRVMATCAQTGFGAGMTAGTAVAEGRSLDDLDMTAVRSMLRAAGVRFDLAPYLTYLRGRRGFDEIVADTTGQSIDALDVATAPDGSVVCVWSSGRRVRMSRRTGRDWSTPLDLAAGPSRIRSVSVLPDEPERLLGWGNAQRPDRPVRETEGPHRFLVQLSPDEPTGAPAVAIVVAIDGSAVKHHELARANGETPDVLHQPRPHTLPPASSEASHDISLRLAVRDGALTLEQRTDDREWRPVRSFEYSTAPHAAGMTTTAGGALVAYSTETTIRVAHLPFDDVAYGEPANVLQHAEPHAGSDWMRLLADDVNELQPPVSPGTRSHRPAGPAKRSTTSPSN